MTKLPVFSTIGQTFGFVVERRFFTLLRLIWFPSLVTLVVSLLPAIYAYAAFGHLPNKIEHQVVGTKLELQDLSDPVLVSLDLLNFAVQLVLGAIIAVAIHRLILLDDRRPGTFFYFRLSKQEVLYVLAGIGYTIALLLAFAPFFGHVFYGYGEALQSIDFDAKEPPEAFLAIFRDPRTLIALGLAFLFALIVLVRFGLTFPAIVAENRLSFARSWQLTRGNFWRLVVFWILVAVLGSILLLFLLSIVGLAIAAIVAAVVAGGQAVGALGAVVFLVPAAVAFLVYFVVAVSIFVAALSFTYQALTDFDPQSADAFK